MSQINNPGVTIQDEGVSQGSATTVDFVGTGVSATVSGGTATITVSGGTGLTHPQVMTRVSMGP